MQSTQGTWQASGPPYNRAQPGCGIAHIGVGNFVRSHLALFLDQYLRSSPDEEWMIYGVGLREADVALFEALRRQDYLYTLTERAGSQTACRLIGSIKEAAYAPANPQQVIQRLAADPIKIISLTVTEKGYYDTQAGDLDVEHPEVRADLDGDSINTALGLLFQVALARQATNGQPFTMLSCDNVPGNGERLRHLLLQFAELKERAVADWIRTHTTCPNSMVDRITPGVTDETRAFVRATCGIDDSCPVMSEAYLQWVVEDTFINGRPHFEQITVPVALESHTLAVPVQFTSDAAPYEKLKMRLLNGGHSALAYVAYLMGFRHVDEAMADPTLRRFVQRYMDEVTPTIPNVPGIDITIYKATLIERFANTAIRDQVQRLAEDGSTKLRNFVIPPLEELLAAGRPVQAIAFVLAAWCRYLRGADEQNQPITIVDPLHEVLTERAQRQPTDPRPVLAVFGEAIATNSSLAAAVQACLDTIATMGTRRACAMLLAERG
jgi:mannitol 2-dehydrogenase